MAKRMEKSQENVIEWINGDSRVGMTLSQTKYINRIMKLRESHTEEVGLIANDDGSVLASVPLSWIRIIPPRIFSEEEKRAMRERLASATGTKPRVQSK